MGEITRDRLAELVGLADRRSIRDDGLCSALRLVQSAWILLGAEQRQQLRNSPEWGRMLDQVRRALEWG